MLQADTGATIEEIMAATGWQSHTVRGAMAGALKRRGMVVSSEKVDRNSCYAVRQGWDRCEASIEEGALLVDRRFPEMGEESHSDHQRVEGKAAATRRSVLEG